MAFVAPAGASAGDIEKYESIMDSLSAGDTQNPATHDALKSLGLEDVPARDALLARALLAVPGDAGVCPHRAGGTV